MRVGSSRSLSASLGQATVWTRPSFLCQALPVHLLVTLVIVPVASSVGADAALKGLFACMPQHVALEVHALVA